MKNYYEILEINSNATQEEIKKAYRVLAKKYHPDRYSRSSDEEKEKMSQKFILLNEAYQTLSNEPSKKEYDQSFKNDKKEKPKSTTSHSNINPEDLFNKSKINDMFKNFFVQKETNSVKTDAKFKSEIDEKIRNYFGFKENKK